MSAPLPALRLTGAQTLRDGTFQARSVGIADGRFAVGAFPAVDLDGYLLLPGIVDLAATVGPGGVDAAAVDRQAAEAGVTTRCVTVPWGWRTGRTPAEAIPVAATIAERAAPDGTDLRVHLACDRTRTDAEADLLALVPGGAIAHVSFHDEAERAADLRAVAPEAFARMADTDGIPHATLAALTEAAIDARRHVPRHLCRLAEAFDAAGILYGSTADRSAETREHYSMIGARLCHDPCSIQVAAVARAVGDPVILSAADLATPTAQGRQTLAAALLHAGLCDALVSGAAPASLAAAAFRLAETGTLPLERAWRLISTDPARILRLPDRGAIAPGKRADLTIVNAATRTVEATIAGGRLTHVAGDAAERFCATGPGARVAAQ